MLANRARARPARPLRRGHAARSGVADRRPTHRPGPAQAAPSTSTASGFQEFTDDEFQLAVRFGDAAALARRQRADPRVARATGADRPADRPLEPPRVPRAAPPGARARVRRPVLRRARDARPRRLQAGQRRLQPRDGRSRARRRSQRSSLAAVRAGDCVCRIGGEEFAIIAPASGLADAFGLAERVQAQVAHKEFGPVGPDERLDRRRLGPRSRCEPP